MFFSLPSKVVPLHVHVHAVPAPENFINVHVYNREGGYTNVASYAYTSDDLFPYATLSMRRRRPLPNDVHASPTTQLRNDA